MAYNRKENHFTCVSHRWATTPRPDEYELLAREMATDVGSRCASMILSAREVEERVDSTIIFYRVRLLHLLTRFKNVDDVKTDALRSLLLDYKNAH
jgi:hypothetical protein